VSAAPPPAILPGAEPWHHNAPDTAGGAEPGFLALHGFTGNPSSMRGLAEAMAAAGFHVELPRLPGHGTSLDDMMTTRWDDWTAAADAAYARLAARAGRIVVGGLSMGAALALWVALAHPEIAGLVCVNPACQPHAPDVRAMIDDALAAGTDVMPGIGSDIADPDAHESAYEATPLRPLVSFLDGLVPLAARYGELTMPLLLFTSKQDHVVEPTQSELLATSYGGEVEHRWLERSYHVATQDFDRDVIFTEAVTFAKRVTGT
jgi:carboxylesterase